MQVPFLGRAPRTKETLPDFLKWSRVTRHPLVFRELMGSQWTPGVLGCHIGLVAYRLALPSELAKLHDVFHVSMLRRYRSDESHILQVQEIQVQEDLSYDEEPKTILA